MRSSRTVARFSRGAHAAFLLGAVTAVLSLVAAVFVEEVPPKGAGPTTESAETTEAAETAETAAAKDGGLAPAPR